MSPYQEIELAAQSTAKLLRDELKTTFVGDADSDTVFVRNYVYHARRVPYVDEFSQAVLVELQFDGLLGTTVPEHVLARVLDRIRKRVRDELKRQSRFATEFESLTHSATGYVELDDFVEYVKRALAPTDREVFRLLLMDVSHEEIISRLNISKSNFYRRRATVEAFMLAYLEKHD